MLSWKLLIGVGNRLPNKVLMEPAVLRQKHVFEAAIEAKRRQRGALSGEAIDKGLLTGRHVERVHVFIDENVHVFEGGRGTVG